MTTADNSLSSTGSGVPDAPGPYAYAARLWRQAGWLGTLPVVGKDINVPSGFTGRSGVWPSDAHISQWLTSRGADNILIRLPRNVLGIDVDSYHDGTKQRVGLETIERFESYFGTLPPTYVSTSRTDGSGIRLYRVPLDVQWVSDLGRDSDVQICRYAHRYVMAWPSVHPLTGFRYQLLFLSSDGVLSPVDRIPTPEDLPALPDAWVQGLTKSTGPRFDLGTAAHSTPDEATQRPVTRPSATAPASMPAAASAAMSGVAAGAEEIDRNRRVDPELMLLVGAAPGEQDELLYRYLCSLRAKRLSKNEAIILGVIAIQQMVNARTDDPWTPQHVMDKVERIWRDYAPGSGFEQRITKEQHAWATSVVQSVPTQRESPDTTAPVTIAPFVSPTPVVDAPVVSPVPVDDELTDEFAALSESVDTQGFSVPGDVSALEPVDVSSLEIVDDAAVSSVVDDAPYAPTIPVADDTVPPVIPPAVPPVPGIPDDEDESENASDTGNSDRFARMYAGSKLRYVPELKQWHVWSGQRWRIDSHNQAYYLTRFVADDIRSTALRVHQAQRDGDDNDAAVRWAAWAMTSESEAKRTAMLKNAAADPRFIVSALDLDQDPRLIACDNGVIELLDTPTETGDYWRFRPGRPTDAVSLNTNLIFEPNARSAAWDTFVSYIQPNKLIRTHLQALDGYTLFGANPLRYWIILYGPTSTGKTTYLELLDDSLGDYASVANLSLFRDNQDERPRADIVSALLKRRVHMSEAETENHLHVDQIKRATGMEKMRARLPHEKTLIERVPAFTPIIAANNVPTVEGADEALGSRMHVVPFVSRLDRDPTGSIIPVVSKLRRNPPRSAILAWLLDGWSLYRRGELSRDIPELTSLNLAVLEELNGFSGYIRDCCSVDHDYAATAETLYAAYKVWTKNTGERTVTQKAFGMQLKRRGEFWSKPRVWVTDARGIKSQKTVWYGLKLNDEFQAIADRVLEQQRWSG